MPILFAATAYSCPHSFGMLACQYGNFAREPFSVDQWMDEAVDLGLIGVEIPLSEGDCAPDRLHALARLAVARRLKVILDAGVVDAEELTRLIEAAPAVSGLEVPVVRVILSRVLCGDRRTLGCSWAEHCELLLARLAQVVPLARDLGVVISLENHQDATSDDLIELCERAGPDVVGVCLDTGNPLAVMEKPVAYARKVAPYLRHAHLKDYTVHHAPEGFRLARCAAGDGVIDFPAILDVIRSTPFPVLPGIEVAAQPARYVPFLDPAWWAEYPPTRVEEMLGALALVWTKARGPDREWRSAWELGESSESVVAEELSVFRRSVDYFQYL